MNSLPVLAVLASILSLTAGTSYGKQLFPVLGAGGTAAYRVTFAAIILLLCWRPWRFPLTTRDVQSVALYGATIGLMNFFFYQAINKLPLGIAIAIEFTGPLAVATFTSRRIIDFIWVGLTIVGLVLILPLQMNASSLDPVGVAYAFVAALLWGLYIVFGKRISHLHSGMAAAWGMLVGACTCFPIAFACSGVRLFQPSVVVPAIGLAIASSAIPYSLEMYALKQLPKNTFSILLSLEPAVGALSGFFVLHEVLSWQQWVAIACVMSASIGTAMGAKKTSAVPTPNNVPADVL